MGGRAAIELKYGKIDVGSAEDLDRAFSWIKDLVKNHSVVSYLSHFDYMEDVWSSENRAREISFKMNEYYSKVKRILAENMDFLENMVKLLLEKKVITAIDINKLKNNK